MTATPQASAQAAVASPGTHLPPATGFAPSDVALAAVAAAGIWLMRRALARRFRGD